MNEWYVRYCLMLMSFSYDADLYMKMEMFSIGAGHASKHVLGETLNWAKTIEQEDDISKIERTFFEIQFAQAMLELLNSNYQLKMPKNFHGKKQINHLNSFLSLSVPTDIENYKQFVTLYSGRTVDSMYDDVFRDILLLSKEKQIRIIQEFNELVKHEKPSTNDRLKYLLHFLVLSAFPVLITKEKSYNTQNKRMPPILFHPVLYMAIVKQLHKDLFSPLYMSDLAEISYIFLIEEKISSLRGIEYLVNLQYLFIFGCSVSIEEIKKKDMTVHLVLNDENKTNTFLEQIQEQEFVHVEDSKQMIQIKYQKMLLSIRFQKEYDEYLLFLEKKEATDYVVFIRQTVSSLYVYDNWKADFEERYLIFNQKIKNERINPKFDAVVTAINEIMTLHMLEYVYEKEEWENCSLKISDIDRFPTYSFSYGSEEALFLLGAKLIAMNRINSNLINRILKFKNYLKISKLIHKVMKHKNTLDSGKTVSEWISFLQLKQYHLARNYSNDTMKKSDCNIFINKNRIHPALVKEIYKVNKKETYQPLTLFDCENVTCLFLNNEKIYEPFGLNLLPNLQYISFVACGINTQSKLLRKIPVVEIFLNDKVL